MPYFFSAIAPVKVAIFFVPQVIVEKRLVACGLKWRRHCATKATTNAQYTIDSNVSVAGCCPRHVIVPTALSFGDKGGWKSSSNGTRDAQTTAAPLLLR